MKAMCMLMSSAGRRVELIRCFRHDAQVLGVDLRVVAVDMDPEWSAACQEADVSHRVPRCTSADFSDVLLGIALREKATMIVPTIDTELALLSDNRPRFAAAGIEVVVSDPSAVSLARNKMKTMACLAAAGIVVPRTALVGEVLKTRCDWSLPLILKPIEGSCSRGIIRAQGWDKVEDIAGRNDYIVQELMSGREYTINCFTDGQGTLRATVPHWRRETRGGEVSKAETVLSQPLASIAKCINAAVPGLYGPWCFQAIESDGGKLGVFEINARFGGGYPIAHHAGAAFSRWLIESHLGMPSSSSDSWNPGVKMLRYDGSFFS